MRFSFVCALGVAKINGETVPADGRLYHLVLPWRGPLEELVAAECQGAPVGVPVIDLLGMHRSCSRDTCSRAGSRARLVGVSDYLHPEATGHEVAQEIARRAKQRELTWRDSKEVTKWPRARATEVIDGAPTHLKLDEVLNAAVVLGCCSSELLAPRALEV